MTRNVLVTASVVSTIFLFACAKTVVDEMPASDQNKTEPTGGSTTTPSKDAGATKDSGTTKKPPVDEEEEEPTGGQCASEQTFDTCLDCCVTAHPDGSDTFYGSYINCLCTTACATECSASLCDAANPTQPDLDCDDCITNNGNACQADVSAACSADPDCIAFDKCIGDSQCPSKP